MIMPLAMEWTEIGSALGIVFGLLGSGGAVWAIFRASALEASNERLRKENEDYVRRLNYIEPKIEVLERENETLHKLHNPVDAIKDIGKQMAALIIQERDNHRETMDTIRDLKDTP